jgi:hypothetical protein
VLALTNMSPVSLTGNLLGKHSPNLSVASSEHDIEQFLRFGLSGNSQYEFDRCCTNAEFYWPKENWKNLLEKEKTLFQTCESVSQNANFERYLPIALTYLLTYALSPDYEKNEFTRSNSQGARETPLAKCHLLYTSSDSSFKNRLNETVRCLEKNKKVSPQGKTVKLSFDLREIDHSSIQQMLSSQAWAFELEFLAERAAHLIATRSSFLQGQFAKALAADLNLQNNAFKKLDELFTKKKEQKRKPILISSSRPFKKLVRVYTEKRTLADSHKEYVLSKSGGLLKRSCRL